MVDELNDGDAAGRTAAAWDGASPLPVRRGWKTRLLVVGLSLLASLAIVEVGLRLAGVRMGGMIVMRDPWTGATHIPNRTLVHDSEGHAVVRINSLGIRDFETTLRKPPEVFRIVFLGDSYVEARQVAMEDTVVKQLERRLLRHGRFEVLNLGMNGFSTTQEYLRLREFGMRFEPDMVLFAFQSGNDVRDNHPALATSTARPFHLLQADGSLMLDLSFRDAGGIRGWLQSGEARMWRGAGWIADHVRLAGLFSEAMRRGFRPPRPTGSTPIGGIDSNYTGDWEVYDPAPTGAWAEAWTVTEKVLLLTRDLCEERGVIFATVLVTNAPQASDAARRAFTTKFPNLDLDYADQRLSAYLTDHGMAVLTLAPAFMDYHRRTGAQLHGFPPHLGEGHWNETGHHVAAECIERFLVERGMIPISR